MPSCLGLFVQDNLIKYAKISKENNNIKVENYGIKFYEQEIEKVIEQIVDESFSFKTPVSINMVSEKYTNTEIFSLLNEKDQKKNIKTEFEYFCNETGKNRLTLDYKTIMSKPKKDEDKRNVLFCFAEKGNIAERIQLLDTYKMVNLSPVSLAIPNITKEENCIIVNIEDRTEVTIVENGIVSKVNIIDEGMKDILKRIAERENSINKAYEICKNTTLYTASSQNLQTEANEYLEYIVPTISNISEKLRKALDDDEKREIDKIYLTGSATIINNIDLFFQENFLDYKCEILTPYFVDKTSLKINIKDYIEVNSAVGLAMQVLEKKNKSVNFTHNQEFMEMLKEKLFSDVKVKGKGKDKNRVKNKITFDIKLDEMACVRFAYSMIIILLIYGITTGVIHKQIYDKTTLAQEVIDDTKQKITEINDNKTIIDARTKNYDSILKQLEEANSKAAEVYKSKNAIPNLLSEIMFAIPKEAQILSIVNSEDKHIVIQAIASEYQYLGYFKSELQNRAILVNVKSTSGKRVSDMIQVTIEGDLPY